MTTKTRPGRAIAPEPATLLPTPPPQGPDASSRVIRLNGQLYLSPEALIERWGHTVRLKTLKNWRNMGKGPGYAKFARLVYYPLSEVERYERREMGIRPPPPRAPSADAPTG